MNCIRIQQKLEDPLFLEIFFGDKLWRIIAKRLYVRGLCKIPLTMAEEEYKKSFLEKEEKLAKSSALYLLSRRSLFECELSSKLQKMGYGQRAILSAVQYADQIGAISEERKLSYLVQKAIEKGKGELYIRMYLKKYKIDEKKIDECIANLSIDPTVSIGKLLEKQLKKYSLKDPAQKRKVILFLQRRGFQLDDIFSVLSST